MITERGPVQSRFWEVDWAQPADEESLQTLFQAAFGHNISAEQWRWKYRYATTPGALVRAIGKPVAFYGGMPRRIRLLGVETPAVQIGDVMVEPAYRRILTRRGPFFIAASAFAEQLVGCDKAYRCAFGFPSERHNRLGEHLGLYGRIGELFEASWEPLPYRRSLRTTISPFVVSECNLLEQIWKQMASDLADVVLPERSSTYIMHRFMDHPTLSYLLFLVRWRLGNMPVGLFILRDHGPGGLELLDMVARPGHLMILVTHARRIAGNIGSPRLFSWLTPLVTKAIGGDTPQLTDLNIPLPTIIWQQEKDVRYTRDRWWLMGGDTDFR